MQQAWGEQVLLGKPERKRNLERPRSRCEDNINTDHEELRWEGVDWLVQDRDKLLAVVNKVMKLRILKIRDIS